MQSDEAKTLLGFPPNSVPSSSQIKAAYIRKAFETHPDRFPPHQKPLAESKFKLISEAYSFLHSGGRSRQRTPAAAYDYRVVKTGVPKGARGRNVKAAATLPFAFIILGAITLAGSTASRAYRTQKEAHPSFNPFLP